MSINVKADTTLGGKNIGIIHMFNIKKNLYFIFFSCFVVSRFLKNTEDFQDTFNLKIWVSYSLNIYHINISQNQRL